MFEIILDYYIYLMIKNYYLKYKNKYLQLKNQYRGNYVLDLSEWKKIEIYENVSLDTFSISKKGVILK